MVDILTAPAGALAAALGGRRLAATALELRPGDGAGELRYAVGREEWLLVLAGTPTLRHAEGEDDLEPGDLTCLPERPAGAHSLAGRGDAVVRALVLQTTDVPVHVCYPESGTWSLDHAPDEPGLVVREVEPRT